MTEGRTPGCGGLTGLPSVYASPAVALATVTKVKGSAPRPPGAKMAVSDDGRWVGSVSGGCVEGAVLEEAGKVLAGEPAKLVTFGITDEMVWDVGLACGGVIDVFVEPLP